MSVCMYDDALVKKIKGWTDKTQISVLGPTETTQLFQIIADKTNDKPIQLPLVAITRPKGYTILNPNKKPITFDGFSTDADTQKAYQINAIPINISYQLDVYARKYQETDAYIREFIFNIVNHPTFEISIPYNNTDIIHNANVRVSNDVEDNSSIPEQLIVGQFYRMTLQLYVDDAYLWDTRVRNVICMTDFGVDINTGDEHVLEEIKVEEIDS